MNTNMYLYESECQMTAAPVAQLGERKTEDLKVAGSSPAGGTFLYILFLIISFYKFCMDITAEDIFAIINKVRENPSLVVNEIKEQLKR